jgi:hypothetical protein
VIVNTDMSNKELNVSLVPHNVNIVLLVHKIVTHVSKEELTLQLVNVH